MSKVPAEKKVLVTNERSSGNGCGLHFEQKIVLCLKAVFRKPTSLRQTVIDPFPGTFLTSKACMLQLRNVVLGGQIDTASFKESLLRVVQIFARQLIIEEVNIVGEVDVQAAEIVLDRAVHDTSARQNTLFWDACRRLCPTQWFPAQIAHLLSTSFSYPLVYEMRKKKALPLLRSS